ncbi:hypothetical protein C8J57DRAFT_1222709 [Mycena rebaudengoi]|nr:hypothetical protein C8J57DRAFT_1222709 [Mycena rebaudengoi]
MPLPSLAPLGGSQDSVAHLVYNLVYGKVHTVPDLLRSPNPAFVVVSKTPISGNEEFGSISTPSSETGDATCRLPTPAVAPIPGGTRFAALRPGLDIELQERHL